jgi:orotidine-5'-phosphate decarboxylase
VSKHFADRLLDRMDATGSIACVGLDPRPDWLPPGLDARAFCREVIDVSRGKAAAIKPNLAFYEDDPVVPCDLARHAGKDLLSIADAKRGDMGTTAEAYAERWLGAASPVDAITVNPFLGRDSLEPFVEQAARNGRGLFVLVKTSNKGSADFQDLVLESGERVYERVARLVHDLGANHRGSRGYSLVGAVVGATAPPELTARLRELMPHAIFLMPGYGAQGGGVAPIRAALGKDGKGVLVPSSRALTFPWRPQPVPEDWHEPVRRELERMNKELSSK